MYPEYSDEHNPYEPLADAYLKKGDKQAAIDILKKFMKYEETSFASNIEKYADLLKEVGDTHNARQWLEGSLYIRPLAFEARQTGSHYVVAKIINRPFSTRRCLRSIYSRQSRRVFSPCRSGLRIRQA